MRFFVIFKTSDSTNFVREQRPLGLDDLDRARKELNTYFPAELLTPITPRLYPRQCQIEIGEETARMSNLFKKSCNAYIIVSDDILEKYVIERVECNYDDNNNLAEVSFSVSFNTGVALRDWIYAGCPEKWGFKYE